MRADGRNEGGFATRRVVDRLLHAFRAHDERRSAVREILCSRYFSNVRVRLGDVADGRNLFVLVPRVG